MSRIQCLLPSRLAAPLVFAFLLGLGVQAQAQTQTREPETEMPALAPSHTVYLDFSRHLFSMVGAQGPMIGANWEYRLGQSPVSLLSAFRLGFVEDIETQWAYGFGLGARRYLYAPTQGAFLQCSVDMGEGRQDGSPRRRYGFAAIEYGYKVVRDDFIFALHGGPQFYGYRDEKSTQLTFGMDLGFPLTARSFRHP
jgi:hypothetical protein